MTLKSRPFSAATWSKKPKPSTMLSAHYEDGSTAYFEAERDEVRDDRALLTLAQERQVTGGLPGGTITGVKRVR